MVLRVCVSCMTSLYLLCNALSHCSSPLPLANMAHPTTVLPRLRSGTNIIVIKLPQFCSSHLLQQPSPASAEEWGKCWRSNFYQAWSQNFGWKKVPDSFEQCWSSWSWSPSCSGSSVPREGGLGYNRSKLNFNWECKESASKEGNKPWNKKKINSSACEILPLYMYQEGLAHHTPTIIQTFKLIEYKIIVK